MKYREQKDASINLLSASYRFALDINYFISQNKQLVSLNEDKEAA